MTAFIKERLAALDTLTLAHGAHDDFARGACAMEALRRHA